MSMRIAWIGAGKMGLPVCHRLKAAGHSVSILARRPEQAERLAAAGFVTAPTVAALIPDADAVFTCVPDDAALAEVMLASDFKASLRQCATVVDMSTVSPAISAKVASSLTPAIPYLRAPVSGSTVMAEAGTLTALVSGPKASFDALAPIFATFTRQAFHLGEAEEARFLKLAINSMVAATAALLGEALAFGRKGGLSHEAMLDVITQSAVASPLIGYKKAMIVSGNYAPAATLDMLLKDVNLFLEAAGGMHMTLPFGNLMKATYEAAAGRGLGGKDFFVLVPEAEKAAGIPGL